MTFGGGEETITQTCPSFPSAPLLVRLTEVCTRAAPQSPLHFKSATPPEPGQSPFVLGAGGGADDENKSVQEAA